MTTGRTRYTVGITLGAAAFMLALTLSAQTPSEGLLTGTITSAAGAPIEGVAVSAKLPGEPITVSVYTQADGRYFFPALKSGKYNVWAQAVGLERAEATADVAGGTKRQDFKMKDVADFVRQLSGYQVMSTLPEDTREHRRGKVLYAKMCTYCHESATGLRDRFDQHGWETIVGVMTTGFNRANNKPLTAPQKELVAYLTEMRGPGPSPMKLPDPKTFRPKGEATLPVVYEYDVEYDGGGYSGHNGSDWRYGQASSAGGNGGIHDAAMDADGNFWFTSPQASKTRTVARVDGKTGKVTDFSVPLPDGSASRAHGIHPHSDGKIYFNASPRIAYLDGKMGIIDPKAQKVESYDPPAGTGVSGWLGMDAKGYVWSASGTQKEGGALRFDPKTKTFMHFKSPTAGLTYGVAGDSDGNGWWMGVNEDIIVHGDVATGKATEIKLPPQLPAEFVKPGDFAEGEVIPRNGLGGPQSPRRPFADLKGTSLWITNYYGNSIVHINTKTKDLKYVAVPYPAMNPYEAMVDSKGQLWVTFQNSDEVGHYNPATAKWTMYSYPTKGMAQRQNHILEVNGVLNLVSGSGVSHRVGKMVMRSAADVQALRARAQ